MKIIHYRTCKKNIIVNIYVKFKEEILSDFRKNNFKALPAVNCILLQNIEQ